ncbi:hypothetical protein M5689_001426 [Euphorbia peplus]|nr:hypothetical protein M5689_001426 [Euphorbia peplus]
MLIWCIWYARNLWVWSHSRIDGDNLLHMACTMLHNWQEVQGRPIITCGSVPQQTAAESGVQAITRWNKPPRRFFKVNVDASLVVGSGFLGIGGIIRDDAGIFCGAFSRKVRGNFSVREGEALGIREALSWVKNKSLEHVILESDAAFVVEHLRHHSFRSGYGVILDDCKYLISSFNDVSVNYVGRSANQVAHSLAKAAYSLTEPMEWSLVPSDFILSALYFDLS